MKLLPIEEAPGKWCVGTEFPGNFAMLDLEGGVMPHGAFVKLPDFKSKAEAEAFIQGLEVGSR